MGPRNNLLDCSGKGARLARGSPYLINDHCHHEQKVDSKTPEHEELGTFEVPSRDWMLLYPNQLIMFERRQYPALIGAGG
jgi:hypothetical protein